jgi:ribonuclease-3
VAQNLDSLSAKLKYAFKNPALLRLALTHRSHGLPNNERLEFLGDSLLNCFVSIKLFCSLPNQPEGELSRLRAYFVQEKTLADMASNLDLGKYLLLGEGEAKNGGYGRVSILADSLEAIMGAVYLDGGFESFLETVAALYVPLLQDIEPEAIDKDPKTLLQEYLQSRKQSLPRYIVVATSGAAHKRNFKVECSIANPNIRTVGRGNSRRQAEQEAARKTYHILRNMQSTDKSGKK